MSATDTEKLTGRTTDRLFADELRDALGGCIVGREIVVVEETSSTNDSVWHRTTPNTPEGLIVFAERQTAGRGQRHNLWESVAYKGLWFSILLRPKIDIDKSPQLAGWAARTIAQTITDQFAFPAMVKLPNDVYADEKKVAGVLVEMRAQKNAPNFAIVGIGINMNQRPEDFSEELRPRATSLAMILHRSAKGQIRRGEHVDRQEFAVGLLRHLDR